MFGALLLASAPLPTGAAETAVEVPDAAIQSQGPKQGGDSGGVSNEGTEAAAEQPEAVFGSGCIARPGATRTFNLRARGRVLYRVVPSRFFDVTMRVTYYNICRGSFFRDRRFAGGTESVLVQGPNISCPVRVTIGGFRGSTGCFAFSATP
jgi:hypothetical protein